MHQDGSERNASLNSSTTPSTASREHTARDQGAADPAALTEEQRLDQTAMDSAKRGQNRMHRNEERTPSESIFSK